MKKIQTQREKIKASEEKSSEEHLKCQDGSAALHCFRQARRANVIARNIEVLNGPSTADKRDKIAKLNGQTKNTMLSRTDGNKKPPDFEQL